MLTKEHFSFRFKNVQNDNYWEVLGQLHYDVRAP